MKRIVISLTTAAFIFGSATPALAIQGYRQKATRSHEKTETMLMRHGGSVSKVTRMTRRGIIQKARSNWSR